jgi:hypothetical protein
MIASANVVVTMKQSGKKANLDKSDFQPSPFDKLRAGSAGLSLHAHTLANEGRFSDRLSRTSRRKEMTSPNMSRKAFLSGF